MGLAVLFLLLYLKKLVQYNVEYQLVDDGWMGK